MPSSELPSCAVPLLRGAAAVPPLGWRSPAACSVCRLCHGPARAGAHLCWSCATVSAQLGFDGPPGQLGALGVPVVPLFLFTLGSGAHAALVGYKAGPSRLGRRWRRRELARLLGAFLAAHSSCLLGERLASGAHLVLVPVPSTTGGRPSWRGVHPLVGCCREAARQEAARGEAARGEAAPRHRAGHSLPRWHAHDLLAPGPAPLVRLRASRSGFVVAPAAELLANSPIVVVDDVFASGTRALSAAAALLDAGLDVRAVVPLGRLVRPDHNAASAAYWREVGGRPPTPDRCCRCADPRASEEGRTASRRAPGVAEVSLPA